MRVTGKLGKAGLIYAAVVSRLSAPRRLRMAILKLSVGIVRITAVHQPITGAEPHAKSPALSVTEITGILRIWTNQIASTGLLAFTSCERRSFESAYVVFRLRNESRAAERLKYRLTMHSFCCVCKWG